MSRGNETQIKVLVVDHNVILLEGIAVLIRSQPDMKLVGTASTAPVATALYLEVQAETKVDVVVIDLELPHKGAFALIHRILGADSHARLIGLTTSEPDTSRPNVVPPGIRSIVAKDRIQEQLLPLIRIFVQS